MSSSQETSFEHLFEEYWRNLSQAQEFARRARDRGEDIGSAFETDEGRRICEEYENAKEALREHLLWNPGQPLVLPGFDHTLAARLIQGILDDVKEEHAEAPEVFDDEPFEDIWTNQMLDYKDNVLERLPKLRPAILSRPLDNHLIPCIREAVDAYILGLDRACIALCRTVIESALLQALRRKSGSATLFDCVKRALEVGLLNDDLANKANEVRKAAGKFIHKGAQEPTGEEAVVILTYTREILERIYGS